MAEINPPEGPAGPQPESKKKPGPNLWMITTFAVMAIFAASLFLGTGGISGAAVSTVSSQQAGQKAMDFINNELLEDQTATFVNITEKSGLYLLTFELDGTMYTTYVSKDGKNLFPQAIEMTASEQVPATTAAKSDKPVVQFFIMSFCPYGQQAEAGLKPVAELFKDKVTFEPHFIVSVSGNATTSLHGQYEVDEDMRQTVILEQYGTATFWKYVDYLNANCNKNNADTCWKDAAKAAGVDTAKVQSLAASEGPDLMALEAALTEQLGVTGSPTIFINGAPYSGGRSAEDYKAAICAAFTTAPAECSQALSSNASAASGNCNTG